MEKKRLSTENMVLAALLTALVVILQLLSLAARAFGIPFSISLALIPIVIGAAICGPKIGAYLGFVCGIVVLLTDSAAFMAVNPAGTVITVLVKGILAGLAAGLAYKALSMVNTYLAVMVSAAVCPIVNTGTFLLGCLVFFMDTIQGWALAAGFTGNIASYMIFGLVGINFVIELLVDIIVAPIIVYLINIKKKKQY